jgi:hypothetical protein
VAPTYARLPEPARAARFSGTSFPDFPTQGDRETEVHGGNRTPHACGRRDTGRTGFAQAASVGVRSREEVHPAMTRAKRKRRTDVLMGKECGGKCGENSGHGRRGEAAWNIQHRGAGKRRYTEGIALHVCGREDTGRAGFAQAVRAPAWRSKSAGSRFFSAMNGMPNVRSE